MELCYWCPTCKKYLIFETDLPVVCGSPICAQCNGQVWKKDVVKAKEEIEKEKEKKRLEKEKRHAQK